MPSASSDIREFHSHGPCMRIDDLSSPLGRFIALVSAYGASVDHRPGMRVYSPAANDALASVFVVPPRGDQCSAEAPAARTIVAHRAPPQTSTLQGEGSVVSTSPAASDPLGQSPAEASATGTIAAQRAPPPTSTLQGEDSAVVTDPASSAPSPPGNPAPLNTLPPSFTAFKRPLHLDASTNSCRRWHRATCC